ncbi:hypothetical protein BST65_32375 [Bradyrhizobium canariense]|nr:hypothetical protein BST65_32375 [Bradyrhizobium canariense]OSI33397.1 hypothetical protein BST66_13345 [Bradyrhizobium canariense]OSI39616.1 hypothetical protein BSZ20_29210 [Bradyrhizobium canariense]OSI47640.1 hypothetical protein BST67_19690 [Bradyrhizobium canariense]OSI55983.1 hypothetical protein BSZ15_18190 [Bradyrhizobium canariense]
MIDHLASIVGGCAAEDFSSVEHFFRSLLQDLAKRPARGRKASARVSVLRWVAVADPLHIALDPECAYG